MKKILFASLVTLTPALALAQNVPANGRYVTAQAQPQAVQPQYQQQQSQYQPTYQRPANQQMQQQPQAQVNPVSQGGRAQGSARYASQPVTDELIGDSIDDVTPPIPVTRDVIRRLVQDKTAHVIDPQEIDTIRNVTSRARRAAVSPYPGNAMPTAIHRTIEYAPDTRRSPEVIRLWFGTVSALVFTDRAGNAWNVESVSLNCQLFDDGRSCQGGGQGIPTTVAGSSGASSAPQNGPGAPTNILNLQATTQYAYGNVIVRLQGMSSPIVLVLQTGMDKKNQTDMQVDFHVHGRSPSAKPELIALQTLPGFDPHMSDFLYGVPPSGARQMKVSGGVAEAWLYNDALYVRTRISVLSPAFSDHVGSAEGVEVYKFASAVPTLLASVNGSPTTLVVSGN